MLPSALLGTGIALAYATTRGPKNLVTVRVNNRDYQVQNLPDKQEAANKMDEIRGRLDKLISHYQDESDPRVKVLIDRFNPANMCENDMTSDTTSYSENKGEKIVVCLRQKNVSYPFVDINTIMFVILHEMAHLMTTTMGHTAEFWANFRRILQDASSIQIYTPVNYARTPVKYCGMEITDNPLNS